MCDSDGVAHVVFDVAVRLCPGRRVAVVSLGKVVTWNWRKYLDASESCFVVSMSEAAAGLVSSKDMSDKTTEERLEEI